MVDVGAGRRPPQAGGFADLVRVRVGDVEAAFTCACERGATVLEAPVDREFGERECTLEDGGGHIWNLAEAMVNAAPEEIGCETVSQWPAYKAS